MKLKKKVSVSWALFVLLFLLSKFAEAATDGAVVEKAKAEGEVVLYTAWGLDTVQAIQKAFAKKYPFIKFEARRTGSERLLNITITEHKQKIFRADLFSGSHLAMINHKKVGHLQKYRQRRTTGVPERIQRYGKFLDGFLHGYAGVGLQHAYGQP